MRERLRALDITEERRLAGTMAGALYLTGAITGIRLGSDAPRVYRSLVEATAFGSRAAWDFPI